MSKTIRLTVIVVCYHSDSVIQSCVDALDDAVVAIYGDRPRVDLVLIANSAQDRAKAVNSRACNVISIDAGGNVGFAPAVNLGIQATNDADFFLLLNPDTQLTPNCLDVLLSVARSRDAALVGPLLMDSAGKPHGLSERPFASIRYEFATQLLAGEWIRPPYGKRAYSVGDARCLTGACLLVEGDFLRAVGGLDTEVRMYLEDLLLCWEAHQQGRRVVLAPEARCRHAVGGSAEGQNFSSSLGLHLTALGARISFVRRTSGAYQAFLLRILIGLGAAIRIVFAPRQQRKKHLAALRWVLASGRAPLWEEGPVLDDATLPTGEMA